MALNIYFLFIGRCVSVSLIKIVRSLPHFLYKSTGYRYMTQEITGSPPPPPPFGLSVCSTEVPSCVVPSHPKPLVSWLSQPSPFFFFPRLMNSLLVQAQDQRPQPQLTTFPPPSPRNQHGAPPYRPRHRPDPGPKVFSLPLFSLCLITGMTVLSASCPPA